MYARFADLFVLMMVNKCIYIDFHTSHYMFCFACAEYILIAMKSTRKKYEDLGQIQKWRCRRKLLNSDVIEVSDNTKEEVINTKIAKIQDNHSESDKMYTCLASHVMLIP